MVRHDKIASFFYLKEAKQWNVILKQERKSKKERERER
jgi:hypothetical protein